MKWPQRKGRTERMFQEERLVQADVWRWSGTGIVTKELLG